MKFMSHMYRKKEKNVTSIDRIAGKEKAYLHIYTCIKCSLINHFSSLIDECENLVYSSTRCIYACFFLFLSIYYSIVYSMKRNESR